jgi:hypothetical protein
MSGPGWANLSGKLHVALSALRATGLDLAAIGRAAPLHTRAGRALLQAALSQGSSPNLSGSVDATIEAGVLALTPARLTSPNGALAISGGADLTAGTVDLRVVASPGGSVGGYPVRLSGPFGAVKVLQKKKGK